MPAVLIRPLPASCHNHFICKKKAKTAAAKATTNLCGGQLVAGVRVDREGEQRDKHGRRRPQKHTSRVEVLDSAETLQLFPSDSARVTHTHTS